jgi:hypothetical protein
VYDEVGSSLRLNCKEDVLVTGGVTDAWPALPLAEWRETQATLHRWMQVVGKVKLELAPFLNE